MWAYADQGSFKMALRKAFKNYDDMKKTALELKTLVGTKFSDEVLFKGFCENFIDKFDDSEWWKQTEEVVEYG